jgi:hypothetical protein
MSTVITDENNVVKQIALIPGSSRFPANWNCYFPVTEQLPKVGDIFKPDLTSQPWLAKDDSIEDLVIVSGKVLPSTSLPSEWFSTLDQIKYGQNGIKILARQYNKLKAKFDAGDYSDGTFGCTHAESKLQCHTRLETLRHVFEMLCVDEAFTDPL